MTRYLISESVLVPALNSSLNLMKSSQKNRLIIFISFFQFINSYDSNEGTIELLDSNEDFEEKIDITDEHSK